MAPLPTELKIVVALLGFTLSRTPMFVQLPTLKMFGGVNPNGWLGVWVGDTALGLLTPFFMYAALKMKGLKVWAALIAFNCVGAWDYATGAGVEYVDPCVELMGDPANPAMIYGCCGLMGLFQVINAYLLLSESVMVHFGYKAK